MMSNEINKERQINNYEFKKKILLELFSKDMALHLIKNIKELNDYDWMDIIGLSLLSINQKYDYANKLNLENLKKQCDIVIKNLECNNGEIFYLKKINRSSHMLEYLFSDNYKHKYNDFDLHRSISILNDEYGICECDDVVGIKPFLNCDDVLNCIKFDLEEEKSDGFDYHNFYYYRLEKWVVNSKYKIKNSNCRNDSEMMLDIAYYIINGKIVYAKKYLPMNNYHTLFKPSYELNYIDEPEDLNLPIPFEPGDLVSCKMEPFADNKNMLILENRSQRVCCDVVVLCNDEYGKMKMGFLKHSDIIRHVPFPCISPLYTLTKISEIDLKKDEQYLLTWKEEVGGDADKRNRALKDLSMLIRGY